MQVETPEGSVTVAAPKERAVLARLALDAGRPVTSGQLVDALWGDDPPASALKTVQSYVARLRRALPGEWIASDGTAYTLALPKDDVDVVRFEVTVGRARAAQKVGDHEAVVDLLSDGLALWRGPAVLDLVGTPAGAAAAARLHDLRRTAEEDLADARLALGAGAELVADLDAAACDEPLREHRWVQLMVALYRADRQSDALRAYQRARAALVESLGIEPGEKLRSVERAVLEHDDTLLAPPSSFAPPLPSALAAVTDAAMAGRRNELAELDRRWQQVLRGSARAVIVRGEPGIGKTRLAGEAALATHRGGALVLFGRCDRDGLVPYQAIVDALRPYGIGRDVPELGDGTARQPGQVGDPGNRQSLFNSVSSFVDDLAGERPVTLVIDDLQWADFETAALLRHLLRAVRAPLMLVGTYRTDAEVDPQAAQLVADLPPEATALTIDLEGLDSEAVAELIGDASDVAQTIHRSTGGSPLFIAELLRFRTATGRFPEGDEVPLGVRQAVGRRLADLPGHARRLLDAAAVAGEGASLGELASVAGLTESDAVDIVDRAIAGHVLVDLGTQAVVFTHDLVRSALLHDVSAPRRAYLHRRVAETILSATDHKPGVRAAAVAHHLAAAGSAPDPAVARWAVVAADDALGRYAWETAALHLTVAIDHLAAEATDERLDLLVRLAETYRTGGMETPARERFAEAVALARQHPDPTIYRSVAVRWTEVPVDIRGELADIISLLRDVIASTPDDGSPDQARLTGRLAFSLAWAGEPGARDLADDAISIARRAAEPIALARVLLHAMPTRDQFDAFDPAGIAGELHALVPSIDDPDLRCQAMNAWIIGNLQRGNRDAANDTLEELRATADRHRLTGASWFTSRLDAYLALADGKIDEADRAATELLEAASHTDLPNLFLLASSLLYDVRRAQGRLAELLPWFARRRETGERIPRVAAMRAEVLAASGRLDEATEALDELRRDSYATITPPERPHSIATLASVAVQVGAPDACAELVLLLRPWSDLIVFDSSNGPHEPVAGYLTALANVTT